jgi:hypothetical protein
LKSGIGDGKAIFLFEAFKTAFYLSYGAVFKHIGNLLPYFGAFARLPNGLNNDVVFEASKISF